LIHSLPIKVNTHGQAWMPTLHNYHSSDTDEHLSCHAAGLPEINHVYMQYSVLINKHLSCTALCRDCFISCRILLQNLKLRNHTSSQSSEWSFPSLHSHWQSIPYDSCTERSLFHHPELVSKYQQEIKNASGSLHEIDLMAGNRSTESPIHWQLIEILGTKVYTLAAGKCKCESLHTSTGFHWIPTLSVTKKNCTDCQSVCWSEYRTLDFKIIKQHAQCRVACTL